MDLVEQFAVNAGTAGFHVHRGEQPEIEGAGVSTALYGLADTGSVVLAAMEGTRPLLVEVQALVAPSELEQPRRVISGLDRNRLALQRRRMDVRRDDAALQPRDRHRRAGQADAAGAAG